MLNNTDVLIEKAIDNWSYELLDNFLDKENLSEQHLFLMYKLGSYGFFLENPDCIDRLSSFLELASKDLHDFMLSCLKQKDINENFLLGKHKNSYISFLSSHLELFNPEDYQMFLRILNEVKNSQDLVLQSFFLKNSIDFFYIHSSDIVFKSHIYYVMLEIIYNHFLNTMGGRLYYDKLRMIASRRRFSKKSYSGSRIALCLCGQLRPGWRDNIQAIINHFEGLGNIDVFVYSWDRESLWPGAGGNGIGWIRRFLHPILKECPSELIMSNTDFSKKFPNVFNVVSKEISKKISIEDISILNHRIKKVTLEPYSKVVDRLGNLENDSKIYYGVYQVYKSMEEYEKQNNFKYDFVIRMRPDFVIETMDIKIEDLHLLELNDIYDSRGGSGLDGSLQIGRRGAMEIYMKTWIYAEENKENPHFHACLKTFPKTCMSSNGFLCHIALSDWTDFLKLRVVKMNIKFSYLNNFLFDNVNFPNVKDELSQDIGYIRKNKIFNEEQINKIIRFFDLITQKYKIITKNHSNLGKMKVKSHLSYKLGQALIDNSKSLWGYTRMPFVLSYIRDRHYKEQAIYIQKIKRNPESVLPPLEDCPDYDEALKEKECFTYQLGQAFIKASKTWYGGGGIEIYLQRCA